LVDGTFRAVDEHVASPWMVEAALPHGVVAWPPPPLICKQPNGVLFVVTDMAQHREPRFGFGYWKTYRFAGQVIGGARRHGKVCRFPLGREGECNAADVSVLSRAEGSTHRWIKVKNLPGIVENVSKNRPPWTHKFTRETESKFLQHIGITGLNPKGDAMLEHPFVDKASAAAAAPAVALVLDHKRKHVKLDEEHDVPPPADREEREHLVAIARRRMHQTPFSIGRSFLVVSIEQVTCGH
jgi:hypothetical protein